MMSKLTLVTNYNIILINYQKMNYETVYVLGQDYNKELLFKLSQIIYINRIFNRNPITSDKKLLLNDYTESMFTDNVNYLEDKQKLDLSKIDNLLSYNGWLSDDRIITIIDFATNFLDIIKNNYIDNK